MCETMNLVLAGCETTRNFPLLAYGLTHRLSSSLTIRLDRCHVAARVSMGALILRFDGDWIRGQIFAVKIAV